MSEERQEHRLTVEGVQEDFQRQPYLFLRLAESALVVAESFRENRLRNTATFVRDLRQAIHAAKRGERSDQILAISSIENANWEAMQGEIVTFIDGGVGRVRLSSQMPILLRVGSYCVRTGARRLAEREQFGYYPVILGDLEGGSKDRKDFIDIVRITAELLGGLSALERTRDLRVLMFHGPLVYLMGGYAGHTPFSEHDVDLFLRQYAADAETGRRLKEEFLAEARLDIYPQMTGRSEDWYAQHLFEPLAWISWLYRKLIGVARQRNPVPIIAGVIERGELREFSERILLERVFRGLRKNNRGDYFNVMYRRTDLNSPKSVLDRLSYTDTLLLGMLLRPGECSESWKIAKYDGLREGKVALPTASGEEIVRFAPLKPEFTAPESNKIGFPQVRGCYVCVSETTEPVRIEVFDELGEDQVMEAARRAYLYARLLPGYGFPVGLDIVDKFAKVPAWLTDAYGKLIRFHLGVSMQEGKISDVEMRRILVQAIYMTHRDWLYRPES